MNWYKQECEKWGAIAKAFKEAYRELPEEMKQPDIDCGEELHLTIIKQEKTEDDGNRKQNS